MLHSVGGSVTRPELLLYRGPRKAPAKGLRRLFAHIASGLSCFVVRPRAPFLFINKGITLTSFIRFPHSESLGFAVCVLLLPGSPTLRCVSSRVRLTLVDVTQRQSPAYPLFFSSVFFCLIYKLFGCLVCLLLVYAEISSSSSFFLRSASFPFRV